ncbi:conserved hypothetical protein [Coccidioides posadasii str. Silveira]|uniref:Ubiquitin-like protease family profile domain-containing protein n=1 Tax=Coccidioides posadasii (strain RMSCC 757 / Silveira) TaxID=443226 RepID=E9D557_COCPS|nr:conserved hypothetical protein [Coccidioides posadasii str. Silveira]
MTAKGIPKQSNNSDCGLYLMAYLEKFIQGPRDFVAKLRKGKMDEDVDWPRLRSDLWQLSVVCDTELPPICADQPGLPQEAVAEFNAQNDEDEEERRKNTSLLCLFCLITVFPIEKLRENFVGTRFVYVMIRGRRMPHPSHTSHDLRPVLQHG